MKNHISFPKISIMLLSCFLVGYVLSVQTVTGGNGHAGTENANNKGTTSGVMTAETRVIVGTVEGLTDTHIKVESGEVGEMAPRYLEIQKHTGKKDDIRVGDRLKIVIGSQNLVQDYAKVENE